MGIVRAAVAASVARCGAATTAATILFGWLQEDPGCRSCHVRTDSYKRRGCAGHWVPTAILD
jgi:hypothetical protein